MAMEKQKRKSLRQEHFNLWLADWVGIIVHFWIAFSLLPPYPQGDLTLHSALFSYVPPELWAAFSAATGLAMLSGIYFFSYRVTQISSGVGMLLASAITINAAAILIAQHAAHAVSPIAVRMMFGLGLFYLMGHAVFITEPPSNPASR